LAALLHGTPAAGVSQTAAWYKEWNYGTFAEGATYFGWAAITLGIGMHSSFYSVRNARIASAVLATAIPSIRLPVCPSVRHTPVLCQNDGT